MWARSAPQTRDSNGDQLITEITEQDIREAIEAAEAVGDDRIQKKTQGQVTEESWTHGSAESRMKWFQVGLSKGTVDGCDTWAVETP
jgi:predicted metalloprotease